MESIFALDIGTRVVMGLIMTKTEQGYEILASSQTEHQQRAMYDGQVHDVDEVARAVLRVKEELEEKTGKRLPHVAVAAAGRALRTEIASAERREMLPIRWEKEDVLALEMEAVQQALRQMGSIDGESWVMYHCVGYDTITQWLEGEEIGSLIGQRGRSTKVTIIATFLPRTVVDGLLAVLGRVGLEMQSLTLEPIAAGQAAIPANMRRMNLALVDIGAGTADIAMTREGSFFAYDMVPMAGDEVTEAICAQYLLDFQVGEKIKKDLNTKKTISFLDFFGKKRKLAKEEVLTIIEPVVGRLAEAIASHVLQLNQGQPQAVILIGGGSLTPLLPKKLSQVMGLPEARVGIQVRERLTQVMGEKNLKGPDSITPIGIGIAALEEKGLHYYSVLVNDHVVPIFELQLATAAEALLAAGIQPRAFLGRPGAALTYELNGEMQVVKGELGQPAQLLINGQPGRLEQTLQAGDSVHFTPGISGKDAEAKLADVINWPSAKTIYWNGALERFSPKVFFDGQEAGPEARIFDGAKVTYRVNSDLEDLLEQKGYGLGKKRHISVRVNGKAQSIECSIQVKVDGNLVADNCPIKEGQRIDVSAENIPLKALALQAEPSSFYVNGQEIRHTPENIAVFCRSERLRPNSIIEEGMDLRLEVKMPILSELLPYVVLPEDVPSGSKLSLSVNGQEAEFTTVLYPGDRLEVGWT
ncbi:MAG: ATPase [Desulfitobacteriaceae bacterium]|nr:ATPase [Desulfitobacteriaceae bacterium]MDI6914014.1 ATPase [Desulfitobacteriaceae bacterium]